MIIIDEPLDDMPQARRKEWDSVIQKRLKTTKNRFVTQSRIHNEDLAGHIIDDGHPWQHLTMPIDAN